VNIPPGQTAGVENHAAITEEPVADREIVVSDGRAVSGKPVAGLAPGPRRLGTRGRALHGSGKIIGRKQPRGTRLR
jgi:hypothetical protein